MRGVPVWVRRSVPTAHRKRPAWGREACRLVGSSSPPPEGTLPPQHGRRPVNVPCLGLGDPQRPAQGGAVEAARLLLMGIFLHDIDKVRELTYGRSFGYSDEGQLIGHLVIGVDILNE
jgi:hypothetical protein